MKSETSVAFTELARLDPLVGTWKTDGTAEMVPGEPLLAIDAVDTYERIAGGALLHLVDARVGNEKIEGAELIGYDPAHGGYTSRYYGSEGATSYEASLDEVDGALRWSMQSATTRFSGTFSDDLAVITGTWDLLGDAGWRPWMAITLSKEPRGGG